MTATNDSITKNGIPAYCQIHNDNYIFVTKMTIIRI